MIQESSPPLIFNASADRDPLAVVSTHGPSEQDLGELQFVVITFFPQKTWKLHLDHAASGCLRTDGDLQHLVPDEWVHL